MSYFENIRKKITILKVSFSLNDFIPDISLQDFYSYLCSTCRREILCLLCMLFFLEDTMESSILKIYFN